MARVVRPEATLEQWLATGTPRQRRLAAIVLARQRGMLIESIARQVGVHRETVRRWLVRYRRDGLTTVKEVRRTVCWVFNREIRARIVAVAMRPPTDQGAACDHWSLLKLRAHLVRAGVVKHISIERLRYILNEANGRPRSWREPLAQPIRVTLDERNRLRQMCEVASLKRRVAAVLAVADDCPVKAVAVDFGMAESTVRRWVQRYRDGGSGALMRSPVYREPVVFTAEVRERIRTVAAQSPRALGLSRDRWSLELLRQYLMRSCVVVSISKEWLRQIVRAPRDDSDVQRVFEQFAEYAKTARPDGLVVN